MAGRNLDIIGARETMVTIILSLFILLLIWNIEELHEKNAKLKYECQYLKDKFDTYTKDLEEILKLQSGIYNKAFQYTQMYGGDYVTTTTASATAQMPKQEMKV